MNYEILHAQNKQELLHGRYITLAQIEPLLFDLNKKNQLEKIGFSVLQKPIYKYQIGTGTTKILIWSQMHGNESTTTKALFDFMKLLNNETDFAKKILSEFRFCIIPMLNPDGAFSYTRENANKVDLNRDFQNFSQPESILLEKVFHDFKPDLCYNLHDQRTIFGAGNTNNPATVSFLSPSYNENRDYNTIRVNAIRVILNMNLVLQKYIPNQIGRFDDSFNNNCVGDHFQSLGTTTILFEAGHYPNDYEREITRKYIFIAFVSSLTNVNENDVVSKVIKEYLNIPQNKVIFYDFVYKNVKINYESTKKSINFAAQYKEELKDGKISFNSYVAKIDNLEGYYGHFELDCEDLEYIDFDNNCPNLNDKANFKIGNKYEVVNGNVIALQKLTNK